jgi:ribosomal protein S18 acetylase RimI-like enzyme
MEKMNYKTFLNLICEILKDFAEYRQNCGCDDVPDKWLKGLNEQDKQFLSKICHEWNNTPKDSYFSSRKLYDYDWILLKGLANFLQKEMDYEENKYVKCNIKYKLMIDEDIKYVSIFDLFVHPLLRRKGIAKIMLEETIKEIKNKYPGIPITIKAEPFGEENGMSKKQLIKFYSKYNIEIQE